MNILNAALLNQIVNVINALSSVLDLPGKILSVIALPSAILAYVSGRRRSLFDGSERAANEALLAEVRQGFQTLAVAIAALSAGGAVASAGGTVASATPPAPSSGALPGESQPVTGAFAPTTTAPHTLTLPDLTQVQPASAAAPRPRVRYVGLAIWSALGLVMTAFWVGSYITYGHYTGRAEAQLLADPTYGFFNTVAFFGLFVTLLALVWACVRALRARRYGWVVWLFLGTLALTVFTLFTMPGLLILVFAIWGPGRRSPPPSPAPAAPEPALVGATATRRAENAE